MSNAPLNIQPDLTAQFWRLPAVMAYTQRSRSAIYRAVSDGTFPRPVWLGPNTRAWVASEVRSWAEAQIAASRASNEP